MSSVRLEFAGERAAWVYAPGLACCVGLYTVCTEYQRTVPRTARKKALFFPWKANTLLAPGSRPRRFFESWWRVFRFLV